MQVYERNFFDKYGVTIALLSSFFVFAYLIFAATEVATKINLYHGLVVIIFPVIVIIGIAVLIGVFIGTEMRAKRIEGQLIAILESLDPDEIATLYANTARSCEQLFEQQVQREREIKEIDGHTTNEDGQWQHLARCIEKSKKQLRLIRDLLVAVGYEPPNKIREAANWRLVQEEHS